MTPKTLYIVRLVHYHEKRTYALQFELDETTDDPQAPTPNDLKNVSIGYGPEESGTLIVKGPLAGNLGVEVIHQFSKTLIPPLVPLLKLDLDPIKEYSFSELYQICWAGDVLDTVLWCGWTYAYEQTGGRATSQGFMGHMLDEMNRTGRILPANELQWARDWLFSQ